MQTRRLSCDGRSASPNKTPSNEKDGGEHLLSRAAQDVTQVRERAPGSFTAIPLKTRQTPRSWHISSACCGAWTSCCSCSKLRETRQLSCGVGNVTPILTICHARW